MKFVNVYEVDRKYGGPEEGGWYYNHHKCLETYPTQEKNAAIIVKYLEGKYENNVYGDIYSSRGGREIAVKVESEPSESQTNEKPVYW